LTREQLTVEALFRDSSHKLELSLRAGEQGLYRGISVPRIQKPGLALTGYKEQLHSGRLLSLGKTEIDYLEEIEGHERVQAIDTVLAAAPACIVITRALEPPRELIDACERDDVPLFVSKLASAEFFARAVRYLQEQLSPTTTVHGVLLDVLGVGILLRGKSGIGKSEAALDLVVRGHRLVADDAVFLRRASRNTIDGYAPPIVRHHMEIRGLGIINVKDLFGISAVREVKRVELVIELVEDEGQPLDRLGLEEEVFDILEEELPLLRLPVRPGRNIATLIEVAARDRLLKFMGHDSARALQERLDRRLLEEKQRRASPDFED
jgi:HPr kinase/phosphorylase